VAAAEPSPLPLDEIGLVHPFDKVFVEAVGYLWIELLPVLAYLSWSFVQVHHVILPPLHSDNYARMSFRKVSSLFSREQTQPTLRESMSARSARYDTF
jgi:hypothetical protein